MGQAKGDNGIYQSRQLFCGRAIGKCHCMFLLVSRICDLDFTSLFFLFLFPSFLFLGTSKMFLEERVLLFQGMLLRRKTSEVC